MRSNFSQHYLNSLHIMARLFRWGIPLGKARSIAQKWEKFAHSHLYRN